MARKKTLSGRIVTITETLGTDVDKRHWFIIHGTYQAVIDYLNENNIPEHKVKDATLGTTSYVLFHK